MNAPILAVTAALLMLASQGCERQQKTPAPETSIPDRPEQSSSSSSVVEYALSKKEFDDPADGYFHAYLLVHKAANTKSREQSTRYLQEAITYFQSVKSRFPDWKTNMVDIRIANTRESLAKLSPPEH